MGMGRKKNKLVFGWGINDVDYNVTKTETVNGKRKIVWTCPYYNKWKCIIQRCLYPKLQERNPTYKGCTVTEEWKYLSNFIKWVDSQPNKGWMNCEPDKDFLSISNKHYSPETVVFVSKMVNGFITGCGRSRGNLMLGVCYKPNSEKKPYVSSCRNPFIGKQEHIGYYPTEREANKAWQTRKHQHALQLADLQEDERVAKALRERYAPDKDCTNY